MSAKGFDFGSEGGRHAAAEWLREKSGAVVVLLVRADGAVMAASAACAPKDARALVEEYAADAADALNLARVTQNRRLARVRLAEHADAG